MASRRRTPPPSSSAPRRAGGPRRRRPLGGPSRALEEGALPTDEFGPFGANSALGTVHGVPLPIYRIELLADAGDEVLDVGGPNMSGPLTLLATRNSSTRVLHLPSTSRPTTTKRTRRWRRRRGRARRRRWRWRRARRRRWRRASAAHRDDGHAARRVCYKMRPNPCTETSCYLNATDFEGGDLLPEAQKFRTASAAACCEMRALQGGQVLPGVELAGAWARRGPLLPQVGRRARPQEGAGRGDDRRLPERHRAARQPTAILQHECDRPAARRWRRTCRRDGGPASSDQLHLRQPEGSLAGRDG